MVYVVFVKKHLGIVLNVIKFLMNVLNVQMIIFKMFPDDANFVPKLFRIVIHALVDPDVWNATMAMAGYLEVLHVLYVRKRFLIVYYAHEHLNDVFHVIIISV